MVWSREITSTGSGLVKVSAQGDLMLPDEARKIVNKELILKRVGDCVLTAEPGILIDELRGVYWKVPLLLQMSVAGSDNRPLNQYALVNASSGEHSLNESDIAAIKDAARHVAPTQRNTASNLSTT